MRACVYVGMYVCTFGPGVHGGLPPCGVRRTGDGASVQAARRGWDAGDRRRGVVRHGQGCSGGQYAAMSQAGSEARRVAVAYARDEVQWARRACWASRLCGSGAEATDLRGAPTKGQSPGRWQGSVRRARFREGTGPVGGLAVVVEIERSRVRRQRSRETRCRGRGAVRRGVVLVRLVDWW